MNHTQSPKTHVITCKGYKKPGVKQIMFAEGHTKLRLVHPQDAKQTTRCVACQKAHSKVQGAKTRAKSLAKKASQRVVDRGLGAEQTLKANRKDLNADQIAVLEGAIKAGKVAAK